MAAYVISEVEVRDIEAMERYRTRAAGSIAQYGGRYLVRAGPPRRSKAARPPRPSSSWSFRRWRGGANGMRRPNTPKLWASAGRRWTVG